MKKYLNKNSRDLKKYLEDRGETIDDNSSVYNEKSDPRPENATRLWISYDISDDKAPDSCRKNLVEWILSQNAESFGASVATFLLENTCLSDDTAVAHWLVEQLIAVKVLNNDDVLTLDKQYLTTPGLSIYIVYRSSDRGRKSLRSGHFVLIQNSTITHFGD